jgi:thiamine-phosphate pyrophosphorylase
VRLPDPLLLLVTDRHQAGGALTDVVAAALAAGCRWVSLRERDLPLSEQIALLRSLRPLANRYGACLTLHGEARTAAAGAADGVHLAAGGRPQQARDLLGPDKLVGISIHGVGEARALDPASVDYAVAGPAFLTDSKPGYGPALESDGVRTLASAARAPLIAIGGIEPARVAEIMAAGAAGIAVMGGVMRAADPGAVTAALLERLAAARDQPRAR